MKSIVTIVGLSLVSVVSYAQITESEAHRRAKTCISVIAPEVAHVLHSLNRDTMEVRGANLQYFRISFGDTGEVKVRLANDGTFISCSDIRNSSYAPFGGAPDKYRTDEEAWRALEDVIASLDLDLPAGLERSSVRRMGGNGGDEEYGDYVYSFYMRPKPYGYEHSGGNYLAAEMHRITGRVISLSVARGWTYEPPDIRVTQEQAIAKAISVLGGEPSDWKVNVGYHSVAYERAPEYMKQMVADQVMRLAYTVSRESQAVRVDTVTGAIMETMATESGGTHDASQAGLTDTGRDNGATATEKLGQSPRIALVLLVALGGALLAIGGLVVFLRRAG